MTKEQKAARKAEKAAREADKEARHAAEKERAKAEPWFTGKYRGDRTKVNL